jgi:hypothetical protein
MALFGAVPESTQSDPSLPAVTSAPLPGSFFHVGA